MRVLRSSGYANLTLRLAKLLARSAELNLLHHIATLVVDKIYQAVIVGVGNKATPSLLVSRGEVPSARVSILDKRVKESLAATNLNIISDVSLGLYPNIVLRNRAFGSCSNSNRSRANILKLDGHTSLRYGALRGTEGLNKDIARYILLAIAHSGNDIVLAILAKVHIVVTILRAIYPLVGLHALLRNTDTHSADIRLRGLAIMLQVGLVDTLEEVVASDVDSEGYGVIGYLVDNDRVIHAIVGCSKL